MLSLGSADYTFVNERLAPHYGTPEVAGTEGRMEHRRRNPAWQSCHRVIVPMGLTLEPFDVTGP